MNRVPGHLTKQEVAARYGVDDKTIDRRRKTEPLLANCIKAGKRVWFPEEVVERYFQYAQKRGWI